MRVTSTPLLVDVGASPGAMRVVNEGPSELRYGTDQLMMEFNETLAPGAQVTFTAPRFVSTAPGTSTNVRVLEVKPPVPDDPMPQIMRMANYLLRRSADDRRESISNGARNVTIMTRDHGAEPIEGLYDGWIGLGDTAGIDAEDPDPETSEDTSTTTKLNSTRMSQSVMFLSKLSDYLSRNGGGNGQVLDGAARLARTLLRLQWRGVPYGSDKLLRRGSFMLGPQDRRTSALSTGMCVRAMLYAFQATDNPAFLNSALAGCEFLLRACNPNAAWGASTSDPNAPGYGFEPLENDNFAGFVDVDTTDQVSSPCSTKNLTASRALWEVGQFIGGTLGAEYKSEAVRTANFLMTGVFEGYDAFFPRTMVHSAVANATILAGATSANLSATGPVALPTSYPFDLLGAASTITVTGAPVGSVFPINAAPKQFTSGTRFTGVNSLVTAAWVQSKSHVWQDDAWHRLGDVVKSGTLGSDCIELGLDSLAKMVVEGADLNCTLEDLIDAHTLYYYDTPHGGALYAQGHTEYASEIGDGTYGPLYDGLKPGPQMFRFPVGAREGVAPDGKVLRAYGNGGDLQDACTLAPFRAVLDPDSYAHAYDVVYYALDVGAILDGHLKTQWSIGTIQDTSKRGTFNIAQAGYGLLSGLTKEL